jgi:hypothetical protein
MADHELGAAYYALRATRARAGARAEDVEAERQWQLAELPDAIAELVRHDMRSRSAKFQGLLTPER